MTIINWSNIMETSSSLRRKLVSGLFGVLAVLAATPAMAQDKVIRLVIPFPPGALTDIFSRDVAASFTKSTGRVMVVENKPGATGAIAADTVTRAPPDGNILGVLSVSQTVSEALKGSEAIVFGRNFTPIVQLTKFPFLLVVNPNVKATTVAELVALAKSKPNGLTYGSSGAGGISHLAGSWFATASNAKMLHVPYKGIGPALNDLIGGQIDFIFASISSSKPLIADGRLRALAITSESRHPLWPDVPTVKESGISDFVAEGWNGVFGPLNMPAPLIASLNSSLANAVNQPDVLSKMAVDGQLPAAGTPAQFATFLADDVRKWRRIVKEGNIKLD